MRVNIVGNLTADPELRFTQSGIAVAKFTVAHTPRVKQGDEWKDGEPSFLDCTVWRQLAEHVAESLIKGTRVIVLGQLKTQRWPDKDDPSKKHSRMVVDVEAVGPDLTWQTASVKKMRRDNGPADDPWATANTQRPAGDAGAPSFDDEPPF